LFVLVIFTFPVDAQVSPGELAKPHAQLEGMSNCTQCHHIGGQVRNQECLTCHTEITKLQNEKRGYHYFSEAAKKNCFDCHSEHHGRNFRIVNFNEKNFDHTKTGFVLTGKHSKINCFDCHKPEFIKDAKTTKRAGTFLGLRSICIDCHQDEHQSTLGSKCESCHSSDNFKPASKFKHETAKYALTGSHIKVECIKCHTTETKNGKKFQKFKGLQFESCNSCHQDFHKGKFGNKCESCHITESFRTIKNLEKFDHGKTNYPLISKHIFVKCTDCHKGGLNVKPKYEKCISCHNDYHVGEFNKNGSVTDCSVCHDINGFENTSYSVENHSKTKFNLTGSHLAIPCLTCHKKNTKWEFRLDGKACVNCHQNIHGNSITLQNYKGNNCEACHTTEKWNVVNFEHKLTGFELFGVHKKQDCSKCHSNKNEITNKIISFTTKSDCIICHKDVHVGQFIKNGIADCQRCHHFDNWKPDLFDHTQTSFQLDGAHLKQPCYKCHKTIVDEKGKYIKYKLGEVKCADCHS